MLRSLYTAVSGVKGHQTYLDVTAHNVANVNTVGFKRDVIQFADMIYQTIRNEAGPVSPPGGVNPAQVGLGVKVGSISPLTSLQGALQMTEIPTDMAIMGEGFFIVQSPAQRLYTRAGNFALDKAGNLVMQGTGYFVQGYKYNSNTNAFESGLSNIVIPVTREHSDFTMPAKPTTAAVFMCNLSSTAKPRIPDADNPPTGAGKVPRPGDGNFAESMQGSHDWADRFFVFDAQGNPRVMNIQFRKVSDTPADVASQKGAESEWDWYAYYTDDKGNIVNQNSGTLVFGDNGRIKEGLTGAVGPIALDFAAVTNYGSPSTTRMIEQNGYREGTLNDWSVSDFGVVTGMYSNGQTRPICQVAVARFMNPQGLEQVGRTCFAESVNSGEAVLLRPGERGAGVIKGRTVEMSNVDLSEEFVNLIRSQRGLQANSRVVTTSDRVLETAIQTKR